MDDGSYKVRIPQFARIVLGVIFVFSGLNYFFGFVQETFSDKGADFIVALRDTGFIWPLLKVTELICGLFLVFGYFGPLALFILAPITLLIVMFHLVLSPTSGAMLGYTVFILEAFLLVYWRKHYMHIWRDFNNDADRNPLPW